MKKSIFLVTVACVLGSVPVAASSSRQSAARVAESTLSQRNAAFCRQLRCRSLAKLASVDPSVTPKPGVAPADVLARTPKGARTLGFAMAAFGPGGVPVLLHFHGVLGKGGAGGISYDNIMLDVYSRTRRGGLKKLSSFECSPYVEQQGKILFDRVTLRWLQPRLKQGPVLYLTHGELLVLPQGWSGPLKKIDMYSYSDSPGTVNFSLDSTDSRGYLRVSVDTSSRTGLDVITGPDGGTAESVSDYRYWNGKDFVPGKSAS